MFLRKKKNKSGVISVQVIDKSSGKYRLAKTIGSSANLKEVEGLMREGEVWIKNKQGQLEIDFNDEKVIFSQFMDNIQQVDVSGTFLLLGRIFDEIGFNAIKEELFRNLVIARLCFPVSKLKSTDYFKKYHSLHIDENKIYRYLDKLYRCQKEQIQNISYQHTLKILNNVISAVFYDVTTLYFEIDDEDELRKTGFSKEGKHQHPQIVLGLLVSTNGYPLAYEIFEGNKFEGHTMLPVIEEFKKKFEVGKLVVIADSGLLSAQNIQELLDKGYEFILGARIKTEPAIVKNKILSLNLSNGQSAMIDKGTELKLVINYSEARAKKDKANRDKGIKKLEKQIQLGKLTKSHINNKGYNKFLKLEGEIKVSLNKSKLRTEAAWDGLKGYVTNTTLTSEEVIANYGELWKIEKAFRIAKTDLEIRPIYHRLRERIEAHICIAFAAYKVYKELERQLKEKHTNLSPEKAIEIAKTIYSIKVEAPISKEVISKTLLLTEEHKKLAELFDF